MSNTAVERDAQSCALGSLRFVPAPLTSKLGTMKKKFHLEASAIRDLAVGHGGCIATDMITVHGRKVGYMYRVEPIRREDSGWCFMAGDEPQEYMDDSSNHGIYDVNTIANYDPEIIPLLRSPVGSAFVRFGGGFVPVKQSPPGE